MVGGTLVRFAQDCRPDYGNAVRAFEITKLARDEYSEEELASPVVTASGIGWNANGMHTVDLHPWRGRWIAAVDGYRYGRAPQCELVETPAGVDALVREWDALLQRSAAHDVFGSHAWYRAALVSQTGSAPHIATLRIDGRLEAILPFVRTDEGIEFATFFSDYNDFIASSRLLAARAFHWILRTLRGGSRVVMRGLRQDSDALAIARAHAPHVVIEPETSCLYAEIDASYFRTRSRSLRKAIARSRRAAKSAGVEVKRVLPDADVFLAIHRQRFGESSRFHDAVAERFVREMMSAPVEAYAITRGDDILAVDLVLVTRDSFASWNGGFTAEAAPLSPGRLLFAAEIEHALERGKRRFDLLRGMHSYKRAWSTGSQLLHRAELITP